MFLIDDATMETIKQGFHVPAKPEALINLQNLKDRGDRSVTEAANIIAQDVELSGLILKTINSPLFGLGKTVVDIPQATVALGFENAYSVTVSCLLQKSFSGNSSISLARFWDEAFETAQVSRDLAIEFDHETMASDAYTLGLFLDCGIAAMALKFENYREILERANKSVSETLEEIERDKLGRTHTEVGYVIASSWNLPAYICNAIGISHNQEKINKLGNDKIKLLICILDMASNLVNLRRNGHHSPDWKFCKDRVYKFLKLDDEKFNSYEL